MAHRLVTTERPVEGETRFGSARGQGALYITSKATAVLGSVLALDGVSAGGVATTYYFFTTSAGVLRVSSTFPTNTETDGSAV